MCFNDRTNEKALRDCYASFIASFHMHSFRVCRGRIINERYQTRLFRIKENECFRAFIPRKYCPIHGAQRNYVNWLQTHSIGFSSNGEHYGLTIKFFFGQNSQ